jgi:hypothetical protein
MRSFWILAALVCSGATVGGHGLSQSPPPCRPPAPSASTQPNIFTEAQENDLYSRGDWLVVSDSMGRVLVYALGTGELKGHVFGNQPVISPASGLLAVENGHKLVLYDLATLKRRDELTFADSIAVKSFSADGRRLFVLTASQTAYVLDVVRDGAQALQYTAGTYRSSGTGPREYSA